MWADTKIAWHIQKNSWGLSHEQLSHQVPLRCVCSTHAPPETQTIQWIANIWDKVWNQDSPVMWDTCEGNLDWNPDYIRESDFLLHPIGSVSPLLVYGMCHPYCYCCVSCLNLVTSTPHKSEMIVHDIFAHLVHGTLSVWFGLSCLSVPGFWSCFLYGVYVRACLDVMMFSPSFFSWLWISHLIFFFGRLLTAVGCSGHSADCWRPTLPLCGY